VALPSGIYDGESVANAFLGEEMERTKAIYWTHGREVACLKGNWKALMDKNGEFKLYDIVADPSERNDLAEIETEVAEGIKNEMLEWKKNMNASNE